MDGGREGGSEKGEGQERGGIKMFKKKKIKSKSGQVCMPASDRSILADFDLSPLSTAPPTRHTSAYVSIRQHTSAYVSIRQHRSILAALDLSPLSTARCSCCNTLLQLAVAAVAASKGCQQRALKQVCCCRCCSVTLQLCQHIWQQISICRLFQLRPQHVHTTL